MTDQSAYSEKPQEYFEHPRTEILPLLPDFRGKVLDVGCGTGATLHWLQSIQRCGETYGIELFEESGSKAKEKVDHVIVGNIEQQGCLFDNERFDLILCLDVLEHLVDPWQVLENLVNNNLAENGIVIACVPNVRMYAVLFPLIFRGEFRYQRTGVLDKTHLRFFTKKTAIELFTSSGLAVEKVLSNPVDVSGKKKTVNRLTFGLFYEYLTQQFMIRGSKS
ncbi:MAG: class I SAM-dependent methyltransferase [Deltaproteobacteria bacterium]|nr:class I SAM-dependent methyltransferase [Deltaproteobacteria bacterium]